MQRCGVEHEGRACALPAGRHAYHMADGVSWENEIEASRPEARAGRTTLASLARGSQPATSARMDRSHLSTSVPPEARAAWERDKDAWLQHAYAVLVEVAAREAEGWTTPEALWPSLRRPPGDHEMRALSVVVQRALRAGVIAEVGAVRLRGTYRTADGFEFAMNKIVPVYGRPALSS